MHLRPVTWPFAIVAAASLAGSDILTGGINSSDVTPTGVTDGAATSTAPVPIVAAVVEEQDVPIYLFGLGTVEAFNTVKVNSRVDGQLQKLLFREGQDVRAGDVLAHVDPRPFQAALREVQANLRRDQAQLYSAKTELQRLVNMEASRVASRQSVDQQRALVAQLEATIEADQAQIDNAKIQLEYTLISSPIDGRTGLRLVDQGNMIHASDPMGIVVVMQLQPIAVIFALPEEELPKVNERLAAGAPVNVTALGRDGQTVLAEGLLATIDNTIDRRTGTFKLKAQFANEGHMLWPGQFVNVRLHLATRQRGILVPEAAVQRGPHGNYVFVIKPGNTHVSEAEAPREPQGNSAVVITAGNTVVMKAIKVAQTRDGAALIDEGLSPGERVVVEGQSRLEPGSSVIEVRPERPPTSAGAEPAKS